MQQPIDPKSQSHSPNHSTERSSKIKPLIFHTPKAFDLCEPHIYTELKRSKKNLKTIQSVSYSKGNRNLDYSRKIIKILHKQNSPSELDIVATCPEVFPKRYFFSKIRNLASSAPPRLTLSSKIVDSRLKSTLKNLSSLKNLTHLTFEIPYHMREDPQTLKTFFLTLACLKKLRNLSIDIHHQKDGKKISSYIAHLSQLQSLKLRIGGRNLSEYASLLPNLPNLTKFSLYLYGTGHIPNEDFLAFFMGFQYTKALRDLTIDFGDCSLAKANPTDIEPLSEGLAILSPLVLKLRLKLCLSIPDDGLIKIFEALKRFTGLQAFDLTLPYSYSISKKRITNSLSSVLSELGSLSSLKIYFPMSDETKLAIVDTACALESLQNLASLKLSFTGKENAKDEHVQKFSSSLKKLKGLQYLDLYFHFRGHMSDFAFESLSEGFKELTSLKNLRLCFPDSQGFTNSGIRAFCCAMKRLKILTDLTFQLENDNIDEEAIGEIAQMMREMPQLSDVYFSFRRCAKINKKEDALESLFQALRELKNIDKITLFLYSSEFNQQAVECLRLIKNVKAYLQLF